MANVLAGVKQKLARFTPKQLVAAGLLITVTLMASIGLFRWVTTPTYDVLFSGLSPADAAAVVEAIEATGTPYQVTEASTSSTILVPAENVSRLRMTLAAENLPGDSVVGYELLDEQGVTVSTFREQVNYQRALEGELARTLMAMGSVSAASVHIVLPRERLYTDDQAPASASVTLTTRSSLGDDEVEAITHLVAASVPDLDPADVTVTDATGRLLSDSGASVGGGDEQELEAAYAARLETRAASLLASVVGPDKAVVRVQTDLDFTQRTRQSEVFDPDRVATDTESLEREAYESTEPLPAGPLTANPQENEDLPEVTSNYEREASDTDFAVSREITSETDAPGAVSRMTISVLLDPQAAADLEFEQVQALVQNAVGFDGDRGDQITVEFAPFAAADVEEGADPAVEAAKAAEQTKMIVGLAVAGVLLLAVLILGFALLRGRRKKNDDPDAALDDATTLIPPVAAPLPGTVDPNAQLGVPSRSGGEADKLRERVAERPDAAAGVLRGLMASDQVTPR